MKTDAKNSVSGSAANPPNGPAAPLTEAEILQQEAAKARAAIGEAFADLGQSLKATVDPHQLTRDHPWVAISTAVVAGFAAAVTLIPSKEQQALRALAELERARHAPPTPPPATSDNSVPAGGLFGSISAEVLKMVRPLLTTLLSAGIARATNGNVPAADGNGHAPDDTSNPDISTPS